MYILYTVVLYIFATNLSTVAFYIDMLLPYRANM